jgi:hypothetical protein
MPKGQASNVCVYTEETGSDATAEGRDGMIMAAVCISTCLSSHMPLSARALALPDCTWLTDMTRSFVQKYLCALTSVLRFADSANLRKHVCDVFDGRLLHGVLLIMLSECGPASLLENADVHADIEAIWRAGGLHDMYGASCAAFAASAASKISGEVCGKAREQLQEAQKRAKDSSRHASRETKLLRAGNAGTLIAHVQGDAKIRMQPFESDAGATYAPGLAGVFSDHHFHSMQPLTDEKDFLTHAHFENRLQADKYRTLQQKGPKSAWFKQRRKLREATKKAVAARAYTESLLAGAWLLHACDLCSVYA